MSDTTPAGSTAATTSSERDLLAVWDREAERRTWLEVLAKAPTAPDPEATRAVAERELATVADSTPLLALAANAELVRLLTGRRWYVIRDAREAGDTWEEIGKALGISAGDAKDYYRTAIERQIKYVPDFHDEARSRRALDDVEGDL